MRGAARAPRLEDVLAGQTAPLARRLGPWLAVVAAVSVAAGSIHRLASTEKPVLVDVVTVSAGDVERTVASVSAGRVAARKRARVAASIVGRVVTVHARKGDKVAKDQVVLELDAGEARANLGMVKSSADAARASERDGEAGLLMAKSQAEQARAAVDEAEATLLMVKSSSDAFKAAIDEAQTRLAIARSEWERRRKLDKGVISPEALERAEKEVSSWESQLAGSKAHAAEAEARIASSDAMLREVRAKANEAKARIDSIEAQLQERHAHLAETEAQVAQVQAVLDKHTIKAPFAGVLTELWVEVGEVTMAAGGMPLAKAVVAENGGGKLFEIIDLDDLYVTAPIDEVDLARVRTGQDARVTLDPWPKEPFAGKVVRVAPYVLDVEEQNRTVEVEVAIPPEWLARGLKPGTSADVEIVVERRTGVPRLPANVLLDGKRALVVEAGASGELRAVERDLEIGIDNWRFAEVKSGLQQGARVVAAAEGGVHVKAGTRVEVRGTLDEK